MAARPHLRPPAARRHLLLRHRPGQVVSLVGTVAALSLLAAACGSSPPSARAGEPAGRLLAQSAAAFGSAGVVKLDGSISVAGSGHVTTTLTAHSLSTKAGSSIGTLTASGTTASAQSTQFAGQVSYVEHGGFVYVKGTQPFWASLFGTQTAQVISIEQHLFPKLVGHWIELSLGATPSFSAASVGLDQPGTFVAHYLSAAKNAAKKGLTNVGDTSVDGKPAVQLKTSDGASVYVASSGRPLPVALDATHTSQGRTLTVSLRISYPASQAIAAPAGAQVLGQLLLPYEKKRG